MKRKLEVDRNAVAIIAALRDAGFEAYIVGGAVRDLLLGRSPKDFDISTAASPEEVRQVFGRRSVRIIGKRFLLEHVYMGRALNLVKRYGVTVLSPGYRLAWLRPYPAAGGLLCGPALYGRP